MQHSHSTQRGAPGQGPGQESHSHHRHPGGSQVGDVHAAQPPQATGIHGSYIPRAWHCSIYAFWYTALQAERGQQQCHWQLSRRDSRGYLAADPNEYVVAALPKHGNLISKLHGIAQGCMKQNAAQRNRDLQPSDDRVVQRCLPMLRASAVRMPMHCLQKELAPKAPRNPCIDLP